MFLFDKFGMRSNESCSFSISVFRNVMWLAAGTEVPVSSQMSVKNRFATCPSLNQFFTLICDVIFFGQPELVLKSANRERTDFYSRVTVILIKQEQYNRAVFRLCYESSRMRMNEESICWGQAALVQCFLPNWIIPWKECCQQRKAHQVHICK